MWEITQPVTAERALNPLCLPPEPVSSPHWPSSQPHRIGVKKKIGKEITSEVTQSLLRKWGPFPGEAVLQFYSITYMVCRDQVT